VISEGISLTSTRSGIPVVAERLPQSRSAAISICIGAGSRDEEERQTGIAHMLEHVLFKGTKKKSSKEISEIIEGAGGEMNAYTSREMTAYYAVTLDETMSVAEDLLAEMMMQPSISKKAVETEKNVVVQEIRMLENNPEEYIHILFLNGLWGNHPMGRSEGGTVEAVPSFPASDLREFYSHHYRPPHFVVVACGNVSVPQIEEWASQQFDPLERNDSWGARQPPSPRAGTMVFPREDAQAYIGMGFPGMSTNDPDKYAQRLLSSILGTGTSSRLFQTIREKEGLAYSIYSVSHSYTDCGAFASFFSTSVDNAEKVIRLVAQELKNLKENGLEKEELIRAKRMLKGVYVRRLESTEARMFRLGDLYLSTGSVMSPEETLDRLDAVTEEDVMRICHTIVDRKDLCTVIHGPKEQGERAAADIQDIDF